MFARSAISKFEYLAELRDRFRRRHLPIVSVDTKKRELVGNFKNPGRRWERAPRRVYDHDFRTDSSSVAIPYGVYDVHENQEFAPLSSQVWIRLMKRSPTAAPFSVL